MYYNAQFLVMGVFCSCVFLLFSLLYIQSHESGSGGFGVNPQYGTAQGYNPAAAASLNASSIGPGCCSF